MDQIDKEIDNMAENMEKSANAFEMVKSLVLELGPDNLRKSVAVMPEKEKLLLKSVLESMKKVDGSEINLSEKLKKKKMKKADLEGMEEMEVSLTDEACADKPTHFEGDIPDEQMVIEAMRKEQGEVRHQGGVAIEGWEGQIIKSEELEKAGKKGEGSRGGKIIGHTKSGKPVYEGGSNKKYNLKHWSKEDHKDAAELHREHGYKLYEEDKKDLANDEINWGMHHSHFAHIPDVKKSKAMDEAKDKILAMEVKEHKTKDPKKLVEAEKKEHEEEYSMPKKEAVKEHKKLVEVLEGESKKEHKEEAKKQGKELKEMEKGKKVDEVLSKPPVSQAQRAAMHAAAEGHSTLGIPKKVGKEFSDADKPGKLPEKVKKASKDAALLAEEKQDKMPEMDKAKKATRVDERLVLDDSNDHNDSMMKNAKGSKMKKEHLKPMMKRMIERKMKKSECIDTLAAQFWDASEQEVVKEGLSKAWDLMEKADHKDLEFPKIAAGQDEEGQDPKSEMGHDEVKHKDKKAHMLPKAESKESRKGDMDSEADENKKALTADESNAAGEKMMRMAKSTSFFYNEDEELNQFIPKKLDMLKAATLGRNAHYSVESTIEDGENMKKAKSFYHEEGEDLTKAHIGFKKLEAKLAHKKDAPKDPAAVAAAIGRKKYGKEGMEAKAKAGMKKGEDLDINDIIEQGLDIDRLSFENAQHEVEQEGHFFVKSFDDSDMDEFYGKEIELAKSMKGEGSKGGKVIGHTRSGKAIYEHASHPSHKDFSREDHEDAMNAHNEHMMGPHKAKIAHHEKEYLAHEDKWSDMLNAERAEHEAMHGHRHGR